jgi:hypothetical protein
LKFIGSAFRTKMCDQKLCTLHLGVIEPISTERVNWHTSGAFKALIFGRHLYRWVFFPQNKPIKYCHRRREATEGALDALVEISTIDDRYGPGR